jgi:lipopolysaccharide export system ATP-binding protein
MNRALAPEKRVEENLSEEAKPIGGVHLNGTTSSTAPGRAADGHALIHVNGVNVDPRTIEGLVAYHIGKQYKGRPVVRDVSIGVQRGEVVGLLGPNGAGKTTCFYVITGLIRADAGAIYLDGEEVTDLPMYQRARGGIGYLPQEASVFRGSRTIS